MATKQAAWEKELDQSPKWETLTPDKGRAFAKNKKGTTITVEKDGSLFVHGESSSPELYTVEGTSKLKRITAIRLEALMDARLPSKGPGRAPNGNFVLSEFKVIAEPLGAPGKPVVLHKAQATFSQDTFGVDKAIDGNPATGWAISPQLGKSQTAMFEFKEPVQTDLGVKLTVTLDQQFPGKEHNLGKFRLAVTGDAVPRLGMALPADLAALLATPADKRSAEQKAKLQQLFRDQDAEYKRLSNATANAALPGDKRVLGGQDLMWALINSPAFLFNH